MSRAFPADANDRQFHSATALVSGRLAGSRKSCDMAPIQGAGTPVTEETDRATYRYRLPATVD